MYEHLADRTGCFLLSWGNISC